MNTSEILCPSCDYDLRGTTCNVCSECGFMFHTAEAQRIMNQRTQYMTLLWTISLSCAVAVGSHIALCVALAIIEDANTWTALLTLSRIVTLLLVLGLQPLAFACLFPERNGFRLAARYAIPPLALAPLLSSTIAAWNHWCGTVSCLNSSRPLVSAFDGTFVLWNSFTFYEEISGSVLPRWVVIWWELLWLALIITAFYWIAPMRPAERMRRWAFSRKDSVTLTLGGVAFMLAILFGMLNAAFWIASIASYGLCCLVLSILIVRLLLHLRHAQGLFSGDPTG